MIFYRPNWTTVFFQATSATRFSRGHQQLIFHSPGTMSSEQLDPRIPPPPPPPPPLFAATNAENGVANGIFNTANPANVTDQPSTDAFLGCAYADSFFNISNVVPNRRLVRHDGIDRRSVTRGGVEEDRGHGMEKLKLSTNRTNRVSLFYFFWCKNRGWRGRERERKEKNSFVSGKREARHGV